MPADKKPSAPAKATTEDYIAALRALDLQTEIGRGERDGAILREMWEDAEPKGADAVAEAMRAFSPETRRGQMIRDGALIRAAKMRAGRGEF